MKADVLMQRALSFNEGAVLAAVRALSTGRAGPGGFTDGIPTAEIRRVAWAHDRVSYDSTQRALNNLAALGLVTKLRRGYWEASRA